MSGYTLSGTRLLRQEFWDQKARLTINMLVTIIILSVQDWGNIHTHKNESITRILIVPNLTRMTTRMYITTNLVSLPIYPKHIIIN